MELHENFTSEKHSHERGITHETADLNYRAAMWIIPLGLVLLFAFLITFYFWYRGQESSHMITKQGFTEPFRELQIQRAEEAEALNRFGWADRDAGIAQVPITIAMEIQVRRHPEAAIALVPRRDPLSYAGTRTPSQERATQMEVEGRQELEGAPIRTHAPGAQVSGQAHPGGGPVQQGGH